MSARRALPARNAGRSRSPIRSWITRRRWRPWSLAITSLVGIGGDHLDNPGFVESHDPETGALQWKWWTTPRKGEPGIETWPDEYASAHGTGQAWIPGTYDPELNLYIVGTGNPNPVMAEKSRKGDNLYTCSIVALNPDTGKLVWYFQPSPHDVHDWDAVETPVLVDGEINGQPRKLVPQASRNGYFFVLDRATGEHILTKPFIDTLNWAKGSERERAADSRSGEVSDARWRPGFARIERRTRTGRRRASIRTPGFSTWAPAARTACTTSPTSTLGRKAGAASIRPAGSDGGALLAIDYKTGKIAWRHEWPSGGRSRAYPDAPRASCCSPATGRTSSPSIRRNGKILWHASLMANPSAGRSRTWSTASSICLLPPAIRCTHSR